MGTGPSFWEAQGNGVFAVVSFNQDDPSDLNVFEKRNRKGTMRHCFGPNDRVAAEAHLNNLLGRLKGVPKVSLDVAPALSAVLNEYFGRSHPKGAQPHVSDGEALFL